MPSIATATSESTTGFNPPTLGFAPLLTANSIEGNHVLVLGLSHLTAPRVALLLKHGARVTCIFSEREVPSPLKRRFEDDGVNWIKRDVEQQDLKLLGRTETDGIVDAVYVTAEQEERSLIGEPLRF